MVYILPYTRVKLDIVREYALTYQPISLCELNSAIILGIAVDRIVES